MNTRLGTILKEKFESRKVDFSKSPIAKESIYGKMIKDSEVFKFTSEYLNKLTVIQIEKMQEGLKQFLAGRTYNPVFESFVDSFEEKFDTLSEYNLDVVEALITYAGDQNG